jgi:hypothetical protein
VGGFLFGSDDQALGKRWVGVVVGWNDLFYRSGSDNLTMKIAKFACFTGKEQGKVRKWFV